MKNRERAKAMRAKDNRSYAELFNDIEVLFADIEESQPLSTRDEERVTILLTSCYWLFRLSRKEYGPLTEWYEQHKTGKSYRGITAI